jgi:hypothetical protein
MERAVRWMERAELDAKAALAQPPPEFPTREDEALEEWLEEKGGEMTSVAVAPIENKAGGMRGLVATEPLEEGAVILKVTSHFSPGLSTQLRWIICFLLRTRELFAVAQLRCNLSATANPSRFPSRRAWRCKRPRRFAPPAPFWATSSSPSLRRTRSGAWPTYSCTSTCRRRIRTTAGTHRTRARCACTSPRVA